jgi:hypothetical protein
MNSILLLLNCQLLVDTSEESSWIGCASDTFRIPNVHARIFFWIALEHELLLETFLQLRWIGFSAMQREEGMRE